MNEEPYDPPYAIARTRDEVLLYLELTPCPDCGTVETSWEDGLAHVEGSLVISYAGECPGCGASREYLFGLPERETPGPFPNFGGPEASELLDAGQWLAVADRAAGSVGVDDRSEAARAVMSVARAAVEEVVKFIPPGADVVPDDAFWTGEGRATLDAEPGRFRLERLLVVRDSYRDTGAN
ncbi:hypothetical protein EV646_10292 [Kribbella antiqua]|uniref:Uncharacterized protein n=1 Tax=Kribbella antiqua TaxID=2512217 RepID=A0A4R2IW56_9ACTN|nr:hypothetical protein [Kribbella antiqua]TCO50021.1 hypothetical protein EV646_10292 [Kribbella antiqua]